jgi:hypothetical protein
LDGSGTHKALRSFSLVIPLMREREGIEPTREHLNVIPSLVSLGRVIIIRVAASDKDSPVGYQSPMTSPSSAFPHLGIGKRGEIEQTQKNGTSSQF